MSVNTNLDHDVRAIKHQLDDMVEATKKQYIDTYKALVDNDYDLAQKTADNDKKINDMQNDFTKTVLWKIAKQHMVAGDLRFAIGSILISREIERIADYAKSICYFIVNYKPDYKYTEGIQKNFQIILKMLDIISTLIDNYENENIETKVNVFENEVNQEFVRTRSEIISSIRHSQSEEEAVLLYTSLRQLKKLERAADHILNIQEILNFIKTGNFEEANETSPDFLDDSNDETND